MAVYLLDNLVSYWKLDEASGTRNDSNGTNHLADTNAVSSAAGILNNGADFEEASSNHLSIGDNASLSLGSNTDFTWSGWIKTESTGSNTNNIILLKGTAPAAGDTEYCVYLNFGRFRFAVANGSTGALNAGDATGVTNGTWFFFVAWYSSADQKIYVQINNGTPLEEPWTGGTFDGSSTLSFSDNSGNSFFFDGLIDEVGFWKRVLNSDERSALYGSGTPPAYATFLSSVAVNLMGQVLT